MRLAPLTTLRLGGPAERLVEAHTEDELVAAVRDAPGARAGRRLERRDRRRGRARARSCSCARAGSSATASCWSSRPGEPWDDVVALLRRRGPAGLRVPVRHPRLDRRDADPERRRLRAGRLRDRRVGARVRPRDRRASRRWTPPTCGFELPPQRLQVPRPLDRARRRVPAARSPRCPARCATRELARALDVPVGGRAPLADVRAAVLGLRRGKGMVIDPGDPDSVSAGSFFTNPILTRGRGSRRCPARRPRSRSPTAA